MSLIKVDGRELAYSHVAWWAGRLDVPQGLHEGCIRLDVAIGDGEVLQEWNRLHRVLDKWSGDCHCSSCVSKRETQTDTEIQQYCTKGGWYPRVGIWEQIKTTLCLSSGAAKHCYNAVGWKALLHQCFLSAAKIKIILDNNSFQRKTLGAAPVSPQGRIQMRVEVRNDTSPQLHPRNSSCVDWQNHANMEHVVLSQWIPLKTMYFFINHELNATNCLVFLLVGAFL